jgi:hypothetical protein
MLNRNFDDLLAEGKGDSLIEDSRVRELVAELVANSEVAAGASRQRRRLRNAVIALPAAAFAGLALTAGAVGVDNTLTPDVTILVAYTTDGGRQVDCAIYIEGGSLLDPGSTVIGDYLEKKDWSGVGQKMYDRAVQISEALSQSKSGPLSDADRDQWAWYTAEDQLTVRSVPSDMLVKGEHAVSISTCTGELH